MNDKIELYLRGRCPSSLEVSKGGFCAAARRLLFEGETIDPEQNLILPYTNKTRLIEQIGRLSLSGMQEKYAITQKNDKLELTSATERSTHILKPIAATTSVGKAESMPANEHLTMQLAQQVFGIPTAANGLLFTSDLNPMYITRRFDRRTETTNWAMEDFAALAGRTPSTHGTDYKYEGEYTLLFQILKKHVGAYEVEGIALLKLLIFNYLLCNGDAHLRNFSLIETEFGDYTLAPAYDLLNTSLHVNDSVFAMTNGLLPKSLTSGKIQEQFRTLANETELPRHAVNKLFDQVPAYSPGVERMIKASFLPSKTQRQYLQSYQTRLNRLMSL